MLKLVSLALVAAFAGTPCSDLTVTGSGGNNTTLTFALSGGAPRSPALMVVGDTTGQFSINIGNLGTLELGLLPPFGLVSMGFTDASGAASTSVRVPRNAPGLDLFAQGFTVQFSANPPSLDFCTSDVESFRFGT